MTDLRPSGTVVIDDKRYDVVTGGEYLDHGTKVKVVAVEGSKVVVRKI
jgi:membrane-bound serine protease (ClpP class)